MSDKYLMENYLLILKSTMEVYVHGTLESSNETVRKVLKQGLDTTSSCQENCYNEMTKYGWYVVENIKKSEIAKTLKKLNNNN